MQSTAPAADIGPPQPETTLYVVGDVHGRADLIEPLMERIDADITREGLSDARLVFVGDYIDRGEASREVLLDLYERSQVLGDKMICLKGNHEAMLLGFLENPEEFGSMWLRSGGLQTIASLAPVSGLSEAMPAEAMPPVRDALLAALPAGLVEWLRQMPAQWQSGNVWVVHAAADPALPMSMQSERTLLWGHPMFRRQPRTDGQWVAHGHTIVSEPRASQGRISVDTGAYHSGRLTAAAIRRDGRVDFIGT